MLELYFSDEAGFKQTPCVPYAWPDSGPAIVLPPAKGRNLGSMGRNNYLPGYGVEESIDSQTAITCCSQRQKAGNRLIAYLVIDNAPIHTSKAFRQKERGWEKSGLRIKRIPAYCPVLNLIEILWRHLKYDWLPFDAYNPFENLIKQVDSIIQNVDQKFVINFD